MVIELVIEKEESLSIEDLVEICKSGCIAHNIEFSKKHETYIRNQGFDDLMNNGIDYELSEDTTFLGQIISSCITFSIYPYKREEDEMFKKLVQEYLSNKNRK